MRGDLADADGRLNGKLGAQAVHAARLSLLYFLQKHPERAGDFLRLNSVGTSVILRGRHLADLERAMAEARAADLPCALFIDSGHVMPPHFDGSPIPTALAIGPARKEQLRPITKRFQVMR